MVIRILDYVNQCYTQEDGQKIYSVILPYLEKETTIELSFDGVEYVPSSFVNTAFIALLEKFSFQTIRSYLIFVDTTKQINEMIRDRFLFEINIRKP